MRKLLISIMAMVALGFGTANAQDAFGSTVELSPDYYIGANVGLRHGTAFGLHFGINDLIANGIGTRFGVGLRGGSFALTGDVIANLPVQTGDAPLGIYAGAGLGLTFHDAATHVSLAIMAGAEYRLTGAGFAPGGIFLELGPSFSLGGGGGTGFYLGGGFNYHF